MLQLGYQYLVYDNLGLCCIAYRLAIYIVGFPSFCAWYSAFWEEYHSSRGGERVIREMEEEVWRDWEEYRKNNEISNDIDKNVGRVTE